jgi:hypothetical protein
MKEHEDMIFMSLCDVVETFLKEFEILGIYAAFAVGTMLAYDAGFSKEEVQKLADQAYHIIFLHEEKKVEKNQEDKETKSNVLDITHLLRKKS